MKRKFTFAVLGIIGVLQNLLIILRLAKVIAWSWWLVTAPVCFVVLSAIFAVGIIFLIVGAAFFWGFTKVFVFSKKKPPESFDIKDVKWN